MVGGPGRAALRLARLVLAAVTVAAMTEVVVSPDRHLGDFFSYFTIQTSILAVVVLAVGGLADPRSERWAYVRGAVTLYVTLTGLVSNTLLLQVPGGLTSPWVTDVLQRILPGVMLLDWVLFMPWAGAHVLAALAWLAYPVAYAVFALVAGSYPDPFLDPRTSGGVGRVVI